jgi:hypothetical protein
MTSLKCNCGKIVEIDQCTECTLIMFEIDFSTGKLPNTEDTKNLVKQLRFDHFLQDTNPPEKHLHDIN